LALGKLFDGRHDFGASSGGLKERANANDANQAQFATLRPGVASSLGSNARFDPERPLAQAKPPLRDVLMLFPAILSFRVRALTLAWAASANGSPPASVESDYYATFSRRTGKDLYDGVPLCGSW
jgi:hypothetical protein